MQSDRVLNREQSRRVDRLAVERYGMTGLVLMENAGRGAAEIIARLYRALPSPAGPIVVACGKGNNGGDGFVVARHLDNAGLPVRIALFCDPATLAGDAAANYEIARRGGLSIGASTREFAPSDLAALFREVSLIIDALHGTGIKGDPRPPFDRVIDAVNAAGKPVVALDLPSGLDCDTGLASRHTIRAAHTITFVAKKPGFLMPEAKPYVGELHVVDIGVPRKLLNDLNAD